MKPATRFWVGIYAFTAVILTIAAMVFAWVTSESRKQAGVGRTANARPSITGHIPDERYQLLARFVPPDYQPAPAEVPSREFQQALELYRKGDDAAAIPALRATAQAHPESIEARFYLGVCLLLSNQSPAGIEELRSVVAAGNTPYLERARFYLAKGLIGQHAIPDASQQLKSVIALHGDLEKQAQVLLSQIEPAR